MTEPIDLTGTVLKEIRDEMRAMRVDMRDVESEVREMRVEMHDFGEQLSWQNDRMELVEITIRDLAEQVLMMGRALRAVDRLRVNVDRFSRESVRSGFACGE